MFFSNETRVADTATPNNFTVGGSDPNVGQYGWTKEDRGNYNQLIQYVEECRGVVDQVTAMATYIEELANKMTGITSVYEDILRIQKALTDLEDAFQIDFVDFKTKYDNFLILYGAFNSTYQDFLVKYQEVLTAAAEAKASADSAKLSETKAKASEGAAASSAKDAADIAEELRKGQVYRGSWNIEANVGYPTAPDTNSVWDIALNEGSLQFSFDGKTWFWGDRLLYLKDDNKFSQIESGSTVVSVNGKSGAVTLNAQDIGSLTFLHPLQSTMPPGFFVGQMGLNNDSGAPVSGSQGFILKGDTGSNAYEGALAWGYGGGVFSLGQKSPGNPWSWSRVYHEGYKPTPTSIGAVSKSGDTMTGPLTISAGVDSVSIYAAAEGASLVNAKTGTQLTLGNDDVLVYNGGKVYHEGFKPTPASIGAVSKVNGSFSGTLTSEANSSAHVIMRSNREGFNELLGINESAKSGGAFIGKMNYWIRTGNETEQPKVQRGSNVYEIYHQGNKPTAEDVGALPIAGGTVNGDLRSNGTIMSGDTTHKAIMRTSGVVNEYIFGGRADGTSTSATDFVRVGVNKLEYTTGGSTVYKIYHNGYKPTAADVGALPLTGGTISGDLRVGSGRLFVEGINLFGANASELRVGDTTRARTIRLEGKDIVARVVGGVDQKIYHQGFKPTASDVGAVSKAGDTMTGTLLAPEVKIGSSNNGIITSVGQTGRNLRIGGSENLFINAGTSHGAFIGNNFTYTGGWAKIDNDKPSGALRVQGDVMTFFTSPAGNPNPIVIRNKVYHEGFKPSAADVGALPITGGSVTGDLGFRGRLFSPSGNVIVPEAEGGNGIYFGNTSQWSRIHAKEGVLQVFDGTNIRRVYHEGYKPTPASIGAVSKSGDTFTGEVVIDVNSAAPLTLRRTSQVGIKFMVGGNTRYAGVDVEGNLRYGPNLDHTTNGMVYHTGYKPTAADVGAVPTSQLMPMSGGLSKWADLINKVPVVSSGGLTELGRYLDMREGGVDTDYSWRIDAGASGDNKWTLGHASNTTIFQVSHEGDVTIAGKSLVNSHGTCGWNTHGAGAFRVKTSVSAPPETLTKVISYQVTHPGSWTLDNSLGGYQENSNDAGQFSHTLVSTDGGSFNKIWKFRNDGFLFAPQNWFIPSDGNISGTVFGGYLSNWISSNFAPASDARLKRNIQISKKKALEDVAKIQFHSYGWLNEGITKDHKPTELGIIAQEMEAINPAYTRDINTYKVDGSVDTSIKALDVTNMLALALKGIQEQQEIITSLKEELDSLKAEVQLLRRGTLGS